MSAKPQVTITLGLSGRVVKRAAASSEFTRSDYGRSLRAKEPIRERLRNNSAGYCSQSPSKRHRRDYHKWSSTNDGMNEHQIGQNDLRFKLMHKKIPRQTNTKSDVRDLHLHEKLSQTAQMSLSCDACLHEMESKTSEFLGQIPPTRSADDLLRVNSLRKSYSSWPVNRFRQRSPDRLSAYRVISPTRIYCNDLHESPTVRSVDPPRSAPLIAKSVIDAPRPATFASKALVPVEHPKPAMRRPLSSGTLKAPYMEPTSVSSLLHSLGLGKYAILFQAEEVDMAALKQMGDHDLKELGIPMGPRKKILLAVSLCPRQPHP